MGLFRSISQPAASPPPRSAPPATSAGSPTSSDDARNDEAEERKRAQEEKERENARRRVDPASHRPQRSTIATNTRGILRERFTAPRRKRLLGE